MSGSQMEFCEDHLKTSSKKNTSVSHSNKTKCLYNLVPMPVAIAIYCFAHVYRIKISCIYFSVTMAEVTMQPTPPGQGAVKRSEKSLVVKEEKGMIKQMSKFSTNLKKTNFYEP